MQIPQLADALLSVENRVATLTLNRDDVRNALTGTQLVEDIVTTCEWVNTNLEVSVLVITGAGRAFSAGGNIKNMHNRSEEFAGDVAELEHNYRNGIQRVPLALQAVEVPIIAAINGAAIGAGFDLGNMCDLRIAAADAVLGETFVNLGIIPGDGGLWFLQRLVGYQRAAELAFSGRTFPAQEAFDMGLLLEVAEPGQLMARATALAQSLATKPPHSLRYTKRLMQKAQRMELRDFLDLCAVYQGISHQTDDHREAVSAFIEKRTPVFTGN